MKWLLIKGLLTSSINEQTINMLKLIQRKIQDIYAPAHMHVYTQIFSNLKWMYKLMQNWYIFHSVIISCVSTGHKFNFHIKECIKI